MNGFEVHKSMKNFEQSCARVEKDALVCPENKKLILSFSKVRLAKGSSRLRVVKCMYGLRFLSHWLKMPFEQASKNDLIELVGEIENQKYSENSKYDFKVILKIFYKWLKGNDETFPPEISWLKPRLNNHAHKLPEELLSEQEVFKLAEAANNPRDKALILVLYESGCRIGEMLSLRMKNVIFDQYGAVLRVTGKTGDRRVRVIASVQVLGQWLQEHPDKDNPNAPLWPSRLGRYEPIPVFYPSVLAMLERVKKASGVKKRIYPHLFRHSRATALASKLTEAQMKEYFGWTQCSDMAAIYVHLSGRDVDSTLLQLYSLKEKPAEKEPKLDIKICHRCKERNSPGQSFCGRCGNPLDERKLLVDYNGQANELMNALFQDPEVKEFLAKKVIAMGLDKKLMKDTQ